MADVGVAAEVEVQDSFSRKELAEDVWQMWMSSVSKLSNAHVLACSRTILGIVLPCIVRIRNKEPPSFAPCSDRLSNISAIFDFRCPSRISRKSRSQTYQVNQNDTPDRIKSIRDGTHHLSHTISFHETTATNAQRSKAELEQNGRNHKSAYLNILTGTLLVSNTTRARRRIPW